MRRRARNAPTAEAADKDEQPFQDKVFVPAPRCRGRGRPRIAGAQEVEPELADEPVAPEVDPAAFVAGVAGINQGLAALN